MSSKVEILDCKRVNLRGSCLNEIVDMEGRVYHSKRIELKFWYKGCKCYIFGYESLWLGFHLSNEFISEISDIR